MSRLTMAGDLLVWAAIFCSLVWAAQKVAAAVGALRREDRRLAAVIGDPRRVCLAGHLHETPDAAMWCGE